MIEPEPGPDWTARLRRRPRRERFPETPPGGSVLGGLGRDLHDAARSLLRRPGHSVLVALTLALGIGATTALFSVVHGVLLSPLPWPEAERLVRLSETREGAVRSWPWLFTHRSYRAWAGRATTVDGLAAWRNDVVTLSGTGEPERLHLAEVTASLFELVGGRPVVGDLFSEQDELAGGVVLLSQALFEERFEARPDAVGRLVQLDGEPYRIVGVMPRGFGFPDRKARAWVPLEMPPPGAPGIVLFSALARLQPHATPEQAGHEATARAAGSDRARLTERALFGSDGEPRIAATPLLESLTREVRPALLLLLAAVALLLVTATANVAGLQLAAATSRRRELAVRSALGAGRLRLARLLLAENVLLGVVGGASGLLLALAAQRGLPSLLPPDFPRVDAIAIDARVAAVSVGLSVLSGIAFGLLPALFAGRLRLAAVLAEDGGGSVGVGRGGVARVRAVILAGQVAVASVLLLGALQLSRSFFAQLDADRGYTSSNLLVARLTLPDALYTPERRQELLESLLERVRAVPGVAQAAFTNVHPLSPSEAVAAFTLPPGRDGAEPTTLHTAVRTVSPDYFEALGRRLVAGRFLDRRESAASPAALVVNRSFAQRYLGESAVGSSLPLGIEERPDWEVVGIVEDARPTRLAEPNQPELFLAAAQQHGGLPMPELSVLIRTRGRPEGIAPILQALIRAQDPALVPNWIRPMDELLSDSLARPRLYSTLVTAFALGALAVAGVGLFGVLSYTVALRRREIGLRVALGARPADVVRLIGRRALTLAAAGLAVGLGLSFAGGRSLARLLWGVQPHDAASVAAVALTLAVVAAFAAALPALRAARIDPQRALRDG
jgi:predicted permease